MSMKRTGAALLLALLLAGCGHLAIVSRKPAPSPTTSPSASPRPSPLVGPAAFLADVRVAGLGDRDTVTTSDDKLLSLGNAVCSGFTDGTLTYGQLAQSILANPAKPTAAQVDTLIRSAVNNLCPTEKGQVP